MSGMSELDIQRREGGGEEVGDLTNIAALLGGEIDGRTIRCPSPGRPPDDRSCHVRIDPAQPARFFIYDCEGSQGAAYAKVREKVDYSGNYHLGRGCAEFSAPIMRGDIAVGRRVVQHSFDLTSSIHAGQVCTHLWR